MKSWNLTDMLMQHFNSMSSSLPTQPNNPLTAFGQAIQQSIISHFAGIDAEFVKEDETKDEFFKNVSQCTT
jgi:hypothetical protein